MKSLARGLVAATVVSSCAVDSGSHTSRASLVYVSNEDSNDISVIDSRADTLIAANGPSNDVSVIDIAHRRVIKRIPVGKVPWGVASLR